MQLSYNLKERERETERERVPFFVAASGKNLQELPSQKTISQSPHESAVTDHTVQTPT